MRVVARHHTEPVGGILGPLNREYQQVGSVRASTPVTMRDVVRLETGGGTPSPGGRGQIGPFPRKRKGTNATNTTTIDDGAAMLIPVAGLTLGLSAGVAGAATGKITCLGLTGTVTGTISLESVHRGQHRWVLRSGQHPQPGGWWYDDLGVRYDDHGRRSSDDGGHEPPLPRLCHPGARSGCPTRADCSTSGVPCNRRRWQRHGQSPGHRNGRDMPRDGRQHDHPSEEVRVLVDGKRCHPLHLGRRTFGGEHRDQWLHRGCERAVARFRSLGRPWNSEAPSRGLPVQAPRSALRC